MWITPLGEVQVPMAIQSFFGLGNGNFIESAEVPKGAGPPPHNAETGAQIWGYEVEDFRPYSGRPIGTDLSILAHGMGGVYALNTTDGALSWRADYWIFGRVLTGGYRKCGVCRCG